MYKIIIFGILFVMILCSCEKRIEWRDPIKTDMTDWLLYKQEEVRVCK